MKDKITNYLQHYNYKTVLYVLEHNNDIRLYVDEALAKEYKTENETLYKATKLMGGVEIVLLEEKTYVDKVEDTKVEEPKTKKNKNK